MEDDKDTLDRELAENWTDMREMEKLQAKLQRHVTETVSAEDAPLLLLQSTPLHQTQFKNELQPNNTKTETPNRTRRDNRHLSHQYDKPAKNHFMRQTNNIKNMKAL